VSRLILVVIAADGEVAGIPEPAGLIVAKVDDAGVVLEGGLVGARDDVRVDALRAVYLENPLPHWLTTAK